MVEVGSWYNDKDVSNAKKIEEIVCNHFSLNDDSKDYFKSQIHNPEINKTIYSIFSEYQSTRISFEVPERIMEKFDESWKLFEKTFEDFVAEKNVQFSNYKNNTITIQKNNFKIKKALIKHYVNKIDILEETIMNDDIFVQGCIEKSISDDVIRSLILSEFNRTIRFKYFSYNEEELLNKNVLNYILNIITLHSLKEKNSNEKTEEDVVQNLEAIIQEEKEKIIYILEERIKKEWESITRFKLSNKKMKMVLSINFADWFLCSTQESWGSCLNLQNNSINFWTGLPGLIGDKNRIMIYLTSENETKSYRGIETERFLYRTWAILDNESTFNVIKWYPNSTIDNGSYINNFLEEKTGFKFVKAYKNDFCSLYPVRKILTKNGYSLMPYLDDCEMNSDGYITSGSSGMYYFRFGELYEGEVFDSDTFTSLDEVINANYEIEDFPDKNSCNICERRIGNGYEYYTPDDNVVCERCYHENYFNCVHCEETDSTENSIYVDDVGHVCETCFHENYFTCEISMEIYDMKYLVNCSDERDGSNYFFASQESAKFEGYILNENDDIYYKPEFMILTKDGKYIHIDEYENQKEFEFEEAV
jgi:hypothetical protein